MELDSPLPTPTKFLSRSRRQFPDNGPPDRNPPTTSIPSTSSMVASGTAVVSYSGVNTASLFWDPSASGSVDPKSVVVTASASEVDDSPTSVSTADKLFTPKGKLFAVGIVIIGFGVLTLLTCIIVLTRCTLRRRRRERTLALARQRAQSQSQSPSPSKLASEKKRKISVDRASEFWSADASRRTRSTYEIDGERRPARPERTGEAESDLRETGPGRVHFTPSVTMSDYTALSMDVQGGSARASAASAGPPGNVAVATSGASVDPLAANSLVVSKPPASKHFSSATRMTLDADPFACTPVATPLTAKPFLAHSNTFPPYVPGSPHTTNFEPQYTPGLSSSPPNMGPSTSTVALSEMTSIGPALSSSNLNHFPSPPVNSLGLEPRPPMHRSSTGMDSMMSGSVVDPFAFDRMAHTSLSPSNPYASIGAPAPLYIAPTSTGIQTVPSPSPYSPSPSQAGSMAFPPAAYASPAFLSATLPQTGMVESGQSYFALTTSPQHSSPLQQSPSAYSPPQQSYISSSPPQQSYLSTPPQPSVLSMTPPQAPAHLQTDVSQALRNLRRRMSDSTVMSSGTGNTTEYRPTLRALDESPQRSEFFVPSSPRSPRHSVPLFSTGSEAPQGGAHVYPSPTSEIDTYYRPR